MAVNKVVLDGETLIDLTEDTVTEETLADGVTAHDASGNLIHGTMASIGDLSTTLDDNSWDAISAASASGIGASCWSVGDRKGVTLNGTVGALTFSNETYYCYILGFDHNANLEGANLIHWQFGFSAISGGIGIAFVDSNYGSNGSSAGFRMNSSSTNSGGWASSYMRGTICPQFYQAMPSDLQNVIKAVTKYTDNTGGGSDTASYVTPSADQIFLLSEYEVFGSRTGANSAEQNYQAQYAFYSAGNIKIRYYHNNISTACVWWLRSPGASGSTSFRTVNTSGSSTTNTAGYSRGFAPGFCT